MNWISVEFAKPVKVDIYICATENGGVWYYFWRGDCWKDDNGKAPESPVTDWMPMPAHPRQ